MTFGNISNIIKGIGGEPEIIRTLGAFGVLVYILAAIVFQGYTVFVQNKPFDVIAFCAAFPAGLGVAIAAIAGSNALKDRNVAVAKIVQDSGSQPGMAVGTPGEGPAGTAEDPLKVVVDNKPTDPVPTTMQKPGK